MVKVIKHSAKQRMALLMFQVLSRQLTQLKLSKI